MKNANDRDGYYNQLDMWGYAYGALARAVVTDGNIAGRIANTYLAETAIRPNVDRPGIVIDDDKALEISLALMVADFEARLNSEAPSRTGDQLGYRIIQDYHADVFEDFDLDANSWTANKPLEMASLDPNSLIDFVTTLGEAATGPTGRIYATITTAIEAITGRDFSIVEPTILTSEQAQTIIWNVMLTEGFLNSDGADTFLGSVQDAAVGWGGFLSSGAVYAWMSFAGATSSNDTANQIATSWANEILTFGFDEFAYVAAGVGDPFPPDSCFLSGTEIRLSDGTIKPIETISRGELVLTYDADGTPVPGRVTKLFTNTTSEFIRLSFADNRDDLVATPGHRFLTETGDYMEIGHMLRLGGGTVRVVDVDGSIIQAAGEVIAYSAETAHMFEQSATKTIAFEGNTVLKEDVEQGWTTYNFEVAEHHNYVAGGVRVHNDSILSTLDEGDTLVALNDDLTDAAVLRDVNGDGTADFVTLDGYRREGEATNIAIERVFYWDAANGDLATLLANVVANGPDSAGNVFDPGNGNTWNDGTWGDDIEEAFFDDVVGALGNGTDRATIDGLYSATFFADVDISNLSEAGDIVASPALIDAIGEAANSPDDAYAISAWILGIPTTVTDPIFGTEIPNPVFAAMVALLEPLFEDVGGEADGTITGTDGNDVIDASFVDIDGDQVSAADDVILAGLGDDMLFGGDGNDSLYGGGIGADEVDLGDGNDYVRVGGGEESFDGGSGKDYISYYDATSGVNINLATNEVSGSWAVNDTISGFESASGSKTGDDIIYGTSGSNTIKTYGGDDRVYAGSGTDKVELGDGDDYVRVGGGVESFDGGSGKDYISYYDSSNGIRIDLEADTVSGSWAVNDTIKNFESASGSKTGDDVMLGTSGSNTLKSYGGDDKLYGRSGDDKLYGSK